MAIQAGARIFGAVLAAALACASAAVAAPAAKTGGDKVAGSASRPAAQPLPARLPHAAPAAAVVTGQKTETAKQLQVPTTLDFDVGPGRAMTQVVILAAGELVVHLEPDRYGDGEGHMTLIGPGNTVICQAALEACVLHIGESGRYQLTVVNRGAARGAFPMVFTLPRALPSLGNNAKPRPH